MTWQRSIWQKAKPTKNGHLLPLLSRSNGPTHPHPPIQSHNRILQIYASFLPLFLSLLYLNERERASTTAASATTSTVIMKSTTTNHHLLLSTTIILSLLHATAADDAVVMGELFASLKPRPPGWSSGTSFCKWSGVKCDGSNRVISISLASKSLSGSLPAELNQLSNLQTLSLQNNLLDGDLPSLADLSQLQEVFLDGNNFKSIPPKFFSGLTSLQTFSISENHNIAPWFIPNELADCTGLIDFYASKANVIGTIPDSLATLPSLQSLRLSYNNLTGTLPASFANSGIHNIWMNNQMLGLSGRLDVLATMTQLSQVWLHANALSGPIPDMSNCTSLFDLQLRDNLITGVVPPSLWSLPKLVNVSLQNNKLQGPNPQVPKGIEVTLGKTNSFCNAQPGPCDPQVTALLNVAGALGYPMELAESWAGNNACNGWNFISCDSEGKSVTGINFGKQHLSGTISPSIADLTSLRTVHLNDNDLTGGIPRSLTTLKNLQVLDVSNNNLRGKVPVFAPTVKLNTSGNPFLGMEVSPGSADNSTSSASSGSGSASGNTSGSASASKSGIGGGSPVSSLPPGVIVGIVIAVTILGGLVSLLLFKFCMKNRKVKFRWAVGSRKGDEIVKSGRGSNMNGNGTGGQSRPASDDIHVHDGGNVVIPIEVLRDVTNNFGEDKIIGRGGFGVVYKGELHDGTLIAVKRMESNVLGTKGLSEFHAEIAVLTKVRHRHLVALLGYCVNGHERLVVYEYMPQGTLGQHLFDCSEYGFPPLTWKQRVTIALDVARGTEYLHNLAQESFIHRDLKPSNILLGDDMRAKVSDFGLVKNAPDGKFSVETRLAGTFGYLAPEYATTGRVTTKVDVFAFGVVLMEILTGRKALDESQPEDKIHLVTWFRRILPNKDIIRSSLDRSLNPDDATFERIWKVAELAGHCTAREPYQRPDMGHAVSVLAPLVEQWRPTVNEEDEDYGFDLDMSLPQALQRWQSLEGTSSTADFNNSQSQTSMPTMPSGFADPLNSNNVR